ncbi:hypothetical protein KI659_06965 [Litoribacter alkaliphilus]|uniref:Uncharacterized protein n=1 Tax=Litoribacter ruber TaxID=702568 RepID=A0AAP2CFQ0_9BACT|nr:hypothetical protein [Litoribacter alkaliphilus]MBS9523758.1 hypothetical protein [Litoribacter alkaliphilus]
MKLRFKWLSERMGTPATAARRSLKGSFTEFFFFVADPFLFLREGAFPDPLRYSGQVVKLGGNFVSFVAHLLP